MLPTRIKLLCAFEKLAANGLGHVAKSNLTILLTMLFLFSFGFNPLVWGQNGPGGVGNTDGVNDQPRNVMWYTPDDMVNSAGFLSQWNDRSGNENNISQVVAAARPEIKTFAGNNYAFFDGSDDRLPINGNLLVNTPYTIFMVVGRRANGPGNAMLMGGSSGTGNQNLHPYFNSATQIRYHHWGNDYGANISPALATGAENFGIFTFRLNNSNRSMFQNGGHLGNGNNGNQLSAYPDAHLGHRPNGDSFGQIDLLEFSAFQNTLNDAQVLIVSNYLS